LGHHEQVKQPLDFRPAGNYSIVEPFDALKVYRTGVSRAGQDTIEFVSFAQKRHNPSTDNRADARQLSIGSFLDYLGKPGTCLPHSFNQKWPDLAAEILPCKDALQRTRQIPEGLVKVLQPRQASINGGYFTGNEIEESVGLN